MARRSSPADGSRFRSNGEDAARPSRRIPWVVLALLVIAPVGIYGVQALRNHNQSGGSPPPQSLPTLVPGVPTPAVTLTPPFPSPRELDAMAFDPLSNDVLLYGGASFGNAPQVVANQTWIFSSAGWQLEHPPSSPTLNDPFMAADPSARTVILVGVPPEGGVAQTWIWNGSTWTRRSDLPPPAQRPVGLAPVTWTNQLLLVTAAQGSTQQGTLDTWIWVGSKWQLQHPSTNLPDGGSSPVIVSDPAHHRVLAVFSGVASSAAQTWVWNGGDWAKLSAQNPPPFDPLTATMAVDPGTGDAVLYMVNSDANAGSTWVLNGSAWSEVDALSPAIDTAYHGSWLLADMRVGALVIIGNAGRPNRFNALWLYRSGRWSAAPASILASSRG
jgi:hypothetical protein